jgi:hypothetical protein
MVDFKKKLRAANDAWKSAKTKNAERGAGFVEFEDGRYLARLIKGEIGESQSSGRIQIRWSYRFEDGEYENQTKFDYSGLESEQNLMFLARMLDQLGYEAPDSLDEIEDILTDIEKSKPLVRIRLRTKGEFQNVYLDKVFATDTEDEDAPAPAGDEEEVAEAEDTDPEVESEVEVEEPESDVVDEVDIEEEDDEVDLAVGMIVVAETSKGDQQGEVIEILDGEGKARVRLTDGKVIRIALDKLGVVDTVPEKPKAPPARAQAAKATPAPAPKKGKR